SRRVHIPRPHSIVGRKPAAVGPAIIVALSLTGYRYKSGRHYGERFLPQRRLTRWSCWRPPPGRLSRTHGVPVLEADMEVDRRDFTVAVAMRVAPGERLALFGPSGAGKTTALERVVPGAHPERGLVLSGQVRALHPAGAGWEAGLAAGP